MLMRGFLPALYLSLYFESSGALDGERRQENSVSWTGPLADGGSAWKDAFAKAKEIVAKMTLEEKASLTTSSGSNTHCSGNINAIPRLGIPAFCLQDGPVGVRPAVFASQFPAEVTVAATWNRELIYQRAAALAAEFRGKGVHIALAPVTGGPLGRSPLGGRNWEGFGSDPYFSSVASYLSVKGFHDKGVVATSKHYSLYEQETDRYPTLLPAGDPRPQPLPISSDVDDATFHESYLLSFAEAVRAGTGSIMCSYNRVNGTYACEDDVTLNRILKTELDFQGYVMSDWNAQYTNEGAAMGGMDMTMPSAKFWGPALVEMVKNGTIPVARLDDMVHRILTPYYALGQDKGFPPVQFNSSRAQTFFALNPGNTNVDVQADHDKIIRKIGEESATLLKNVRTNGGGLPLAKSKFLAVFGQDAGANPYGLLACGDTSRCPNHPNNGTITVGGGSGANYAPYVVTPLEAIQARAKSSKTHINWLLDDLDLSTAKTNAIIADTSIVFTYAYIKESIDRDNLTLWSNGDKLINTVAAQCNNTIVVIHSGQQILMESWIDNPNVTAVVFAYYPGQETGNSIASVLYGDVNPSGKLPFTLAKTISDYLPDGIHAENSTDPHVVFKEGNLIDYRWFDAKGITPRFEFGYGLSYTTFGYSNLRIQSTPGKPMDGIQLTKEPFNGAGSLYDVAYTVTALIKNTGQVAGCEVAQLYLAYPPSQTKQPVRSLRGFDKVCLNKGQTKTATFKIRQKDHAVWDVVSQTWTIPKGEFTVHVGSSSRILPLKVTFTV